MNCYSLSLHLLLNPSIICLSSDPQKAVSEEYGEDRNNLSDDFFWDTSSEVEQFVNFKSTYNEVIRDLLI